MSNPTRIEAVIFDMEGVLTDSEPLINAAAVEMFREYGFEVRPEDFIPFVGTGENRYIGGVAEKYRFDVEINAAKKRTYEIYLELVPEQLEAFPGAQALVRECRRAVLRTAVASSADAVKIEANLKKIGLPPESWDAILTGEDVEHRKPEPDIFLSAAQRLGLEEGRESELDSIRPRLDQQDLHAGTRPRSWPGWRRRANSRPARPPGRTSRSPA